jgi:hypothetical protein
LGEVALAVVCILNFMPADSVAGHGIPYEGLNGQKLLSLDHLRAMGSPCYVYDKNGKKLDLRTMRGCWVSYASSVCDCTAAYHIIFLDGAPPRVITAVDVFGDLSSLQHVRAPERPAGGAPGCR